MSQEGREEYLAFMRGRYTGQDREGKSRLIDEMCELLGVSQQQAIKMLNRAVGETGAETCR